MIIWLASYPKSGNTWVRSFLTTLLFNKKNEVNFHDLNKIRQYPLRSDFENLVSNLDDIKELSTKWIASQEKINSDKKIKILKTHHALCNLNNNYFTNLENTLGAIYIVRDPRNIVTSIKHHFSKENLQDSVKFIFDENKILGENFKLKKIKKKDNELITVISSWKTHYNSWKLLNKNFLIIKYENLVLNPKKEFYKIISYLEKFLKITFNEKQINKSIELNSFKNLEKIENMKGFDEAPIDKNTGNRKKFFNLGPKNDWKNILDKEIKNSIENNFELEMKELGYI